MAVALPALTAAPGAGKNDWGRLGRLAKTQTVKVYSTDGKARTGTLQEFRADGLRFEDENKLTEILPRDIQSTTLTDGGLVRKVEGHPAFRSGQVVELTMRDGRLIKGTVRTFNEGRLRLAQSTAIVDLRREDVVRLTSRSHKCWPAAVIGGLAGAVFGLGAIKCGSLGCGDSGESQGKLPAQAFVVGPLVGAGVDLAIGCTKTIYEVVPPGT
jgi:hypothetical protein